MKFTFLLILMLHTYHIHAQKATEEAKKIIPEDSLPSILFFAEQMPMFRDSACMNLATYNERKSCADQKLLSFIFSHIRYPKAAREMGLEASVILSFVIGVDGSLSDFKILKANDNPIFAEELIRVIKLTVEENGSWVPARQGGANVPVRINLPCKLCFR